MCVHKLLFNRKNTTSMLSLIVLILRFFTRHINAKSLLLGTTTGHTGEWRKSDQVVEVRHVLAL